MAPYRPRNHSDQALDVTETEALSAIETESLPGAMWMTRPSGKAMRTAIFEQDGVWHVLAAGERGAVEDDTEHQSESAALEDFVERLRATKVLIDNGWT